MSTNRQPRDREKAIEAYEERFYDAIGDAYKLYQANALRVHISHSREGKIKGVTSISVLPDEGCIAAYKRAAPGIVCGKCYAMGALCTYRVNMIKRLAENTVLLSGPVRDHALPRGLIGPVRINAYGEVMNTNHARWVVAIARANPKATVSVITKQPGHFATVTRPRNLVIVASHYRLDEMSLDNRADKTYCVINGPTTEEMKRDPDNAPCLDGCMNCYLQGAGCYSKTGPKRIVREFQN